MWMDDNWGETFTVKASLPSSNCLYHNPNFGFQSSTLSSPQRQTGDEGVSIYLLFLPDRLESRVTIICQMTFDLKLFTENVAA
jgi:hypothetical protein